MAEEFETMFGVSIRYPRKPGESFNFDHWARIHMPLGIATLERASQHTPRQVLVQHETFGIDGTPESADSYITVWLLFDNRAGLEAFMRLHNDRRKSAELTNDFENYAPLPPSIMLGEITIFDNMEAILDRGRALL